MKTPEEMFADRRRTMVEDQIAARGVKDRKVLDAMGRVPRHMFVPNEFVLMAYADEPLPIGEEQTISQPYIVAVMTEALELAGTERVLEIGTGSGYQTAVLAELARCVYTIERRSGLSSRARGILDGMGFGNVEFRTGDGSLGWPEEAPFDAVIVTAAARTIPAVLEEQLGAGGRMVLPVGGWDQTLVALRRTANGLESRAMFRVRFVPLVTGG